MAELHVPRANGLTSVRSLPSPRAAPRCIQLPANDDPGPLSVTIESCRDRLRCKANKRSEAVVSAILARTTKGHFAEEKN